ncbi:TPA: Dr family adhesin structural subunit [Escherichia coli]
MKKLAIMAAASMMVAVSTAHAQFSYSGNTGTVKVTVTEECQIQVGDFSTTKPRSQLTNGAAIGPINVTARGCDTRQIALQAGADNIEGDKLYMRSDNGGDKLYVVLSALDGSNWTTDNGVFYNTVPGNWGGTIGVRVQGDQTFTPTGNYTLTLTGGYWTN